MFLRNDINLTNEFTKLLSQLLSFYLQKIYALN